MSQTPTRLGAGRYVDAAAEPDRVTTTVHQLTTSDGAQVSGVLRRVPGARTVVTLMHPRQDLTHHVLVPELLRHGYAVWTQGARSVNHDIALVHEQTLLDVAAGQVFLRRKGSEGAGFDNVVTLGHSGGGTLFAYYHEQSSLDPDDRIARTPAGRPSRLGDAEMPRPDGAVFMAPHPGQGVLLQRLIDPSVVDESDPMSTDPELSAFEPANGFAEPPESSSYSPEFVERYRAAQAARIRRIDDHARQLAADADAARARSRAHGDVVDRRASLAPRIITTYRTDADLRFVDLSLDPNRRPYGSLFGHRPDLTNFGLVGFGRLATPDAWLSTWSANTSNASFLRCAPGVGVPTLFVELTGDAACFPTDAVAMVEALGTEDKTHVRAAGTHFGGPIAPGEPTGAELAAAHIGPWLAEKFTR